VDQSNPKNYLQSEHEFYAEIEQYFHDSSSGYSEKMHAFSRFVPRQALSYFVARNEIFKEIVPLHGSIFDFGSYRGSSLFTWLQLSSIYEPYNHLRKIIGFDSFQGFSALGANDQGTDVKSFQLKREGGMFFPNGKEELDKGVALHDLNRPLGHVEKTWVNKGELPGSFSRYLEEHPETIVALANFGLGLYLPTLEILDSLRPRLQKGSVLVFEDLNQALWPGETKALFEMFSPYEISLQRFPYCPHISWMRVGG
jgi:hypothetical protein